MSATSTQRIQLKLKRERPWVTHTAFSNQPGTRAKATKIDGLSIIQYLPAITLMIILTGCDNMKTLESIDNVDTQRFMGDWYVLAHIPPFFTKNAYNSVERYRLQADGTVDVLFTYNEGDFDGELKTMTPTGFPNEGDAEGTWGMRFIWPFKNDYRIVYLNAEYTQTIIGRDKRDYVWIMARTPSIPEGEYQALVRQVDKLGYHINELRKVPQQSLIKRSTPEVARDF